MRPERGCSFGVAPSAGLVARECDVVEWVHGLRRFPSALRIFEDSTSSFRGGFPRVCQHFGIRTLRGFWILTREAAADLQTLRLGDLSL